MDGCRRCHRDCSRLGGWSGKAACSAMKTLGGRRNGLLQSGGVVSRTLPDDIFLSPITSIWILFRTDI